MRTHLTPTILAGALALALATAPAVAQTRDGMPLGGRMLLTAGHEDGDMPLAPYTVDVLFARAVFRSPLGGPHWIDVTGRWGDAFDVGSITGFSAAYSISLLNGPTALPTAVGVSLGAEMDRWSLDEGNGTRFAVPARFAFGIRLPAGLVAVTPHVGFGVKWQRSSGEAVHPNSEQPGQRTSVDESGFRPIGEVGLALHVWRVMVAAGLAHEFSEHQRVRLSAGFELPLPTDTPLAAGSR